MLMMHASLVSQLHLMYLACKHIVLTCNSSKNTPYLLSRMWPSIVGPGSSWFNILLVLCICFSAAGVVSDCIEGAQCSCFHWSGD